MANKIMSTLTTIPSVTKLSNNIIRILGCNPGIMTLQGTNTYLIGTGQKRVLIDSGQADTAPAYTTLLKEVLTKENASIQYLLLSHWHGDHIGGVAAIREMFENENSINKSDPISVLKLPRAKNDQMNVIEKYEKYGNTPFVYWEPLEDEQCVEVEGAKLRVKHTPGHATDHACFLLEDENALFSGDCILGEGTAIFEDLHAYLMSLHKILEMKPVVIYPAHGPVINDPIQRIQFYISHRTKRENEIVNVLSEASEPMSEIDIVEILYKDKSQELWPAAAFNIGHHLKKLKKENKVSGDVGSWTLNKFEKISKM